MQETNSAYEISTAGAPAESAVADESGSQACDGQQLLSIDGIFAGEAVNYLESCDGEHSRAVPEKFLDLEVRREEAVPSFFAMTSPCVSNHDEINICSRGYIKSKLIA